MDNWSLRLTSFEAFRSKCAAENHNAVKQQAVSNISASTILNGWNNGNENIEFFSFDSDSRTEDVPIKWEPSVMNKNVIDCRAINDIENFFQNLDEIEPERRLFVLYKHLQARHYDVALTVMDQSIALCINDIERYEEDILRMFEQIIEAFGRVPGAMEGHSVKTVLFHPSANEKNIRIIFVSPH